MLLEDLFVFQRDDVFFHARLATDHGQPKDTTAALSAKGGWEPFVVSMRLELRPYFLIMWTTVKTTPTCPVPLQPDLVPITNLEVPVYLAVSAKSSKKAERRKQIQCRAKFLESSCAPAPGRNSPDLEPPCGR